MRPHCFFVRFVVYCQRCLEATEGKEEWNETYTMYWKNVVF
jgi:hypothetical protein